MNKLLLLAPALAGVLTACDTRECESNFDCGMYAQCTADGLCVAGGRPDVDAGSGAIVLDGGDVVFDDGSDGAGGGAAVSDGVSIADTHFDGVIGGTGLDRAMDPSLWVSGVSMSVTLSRPGAPSTFVSITFDDRAALETPGSFTIGDTTGFLQACNYDTASYDEVLPPAEVVVSPPVDDGGVPVTVVFDDDAGTTGVAEFTYRVVGP